LIIIDSLNKIEVHGLKFKFLKRHFKWWFYNFIFFIGNSYLNKYLRIHVFFHIIKSVFVPWLFRPVPIASLCSFERHDHRIPRRSISPHVDFEHFKIEIDYQFHWCYDHGDVTQRSHYYIFAHFYQLFLRCNDLFKFVIAYT
jgi:hypothetical protein